MAKGALARGPEVRVTAAQAAAFRLARHRLASGSTAAAIVDIVGGSGGIQAQVMSAAELSIWTRRRQTTREEIRAALWDDRVIVRTSAMRLTLHLIASRDLSIYLAAMRESAFRRIDYWLGRMGATPRQIQKMVAAVVDSLEDGSPRTQQELIAAAKRRVGRGMGTWMDHSWSGVRPAVIEGAIVYGPPRGAEATFVRTDAWVGRPPAMDPGEARLELLRRFLAAFGPATPHDFSKWSGLAVSEATRLLAASGDSLAAVAVDGAPGWIRREDIDALRGSRLDADAVTLLGAFDSFLLAHATKEHLVDPRRYKRVYRPQGWISPVVLRGGRVIGVWFPESGGRRATLRVELFERVPPSHRDAIAREAAEMSAFLSTPCDVRFSTV